MKQIALPSSAELMMHWRRVRRAFDARLMTERRLLIVAAACVIWFLLDTIWVTPAYQHLNKATKRKSAAASSRQMLVTQKDQLAQAMVLQKQGAQKELLLVQERLAKGQQELERAQSQMAPAREMRQLLDAMLARHGQLKLRSMRTLPPTEVRMGGSESISGGAPLYSHGLELVVEGGFHELLAWLRSVESMPRRLIWQSMKLSSDEQSRLTLTLQVHTLSPDKEPLEIAP
ncbi:MAG TPA: hypothetical protein VFW84_15045 [Aquabacterium sp.]|uniref:hypothetical protein n=1 Tax=Aquabacterium sp. TaxID=1872578 RepID=UPI002E34D9CC|nr:hypothetical protein [Aquabacterium sp.]HEX5374042.1 hypothetical protein [Aquabacterium sp.]